MWYSTFEPGSLSQGNVLQEVFSVDPSPSSCCILLSVHNFDPENLNSVHRAQSATIASPTHRRFETLGKVDKRVDYHVSHVHNHLNAIDFDDNVTAYRNKPTRDIIRSLFVLRMCSMETLVKRSFSVMVRINRLCGPRVLKLLVKPMYKQFVAGDTIDAIQHCAQRLQNEGIKPMLSCTMETEYTTEEERRATYQHNYQRVLECLDISMSLNTSKPMLQLKLTALLSTDLLVNIGNLFAGSRDQVRLVEDISRCLQGTCSEVLEFKILNPEARLELQVLMERLRQIGQTARDKGVKILVDAEHTYENLGLSLLSLAMMAAYNSTTSIVWNTYQCYLKKTMDNVKNEMSIARRLNVYFGIKLVRGAYVSQERDEAKRIGLPDPVCENYKTTNDNYNRVLSFLLDTASKPGAKINIMVATHNEESTKLAVTRIREYKLDRLQDTVVTFGHLLGMCDHISVILAQAGYQVYKALPYGPVEMVMPYLARRAAENKTGLMGARREQQLLWEELKRRLWRQCSCCVCFPY